MRFVPGQRKKPEGGCAVESGHWGRWVSSLCWGAGLAMLIGFAAEPAMRPQSGVPSMSHRSAQMPRDPAVSSEYDPIAAERQFKALNIERQRDMVSDTNKLLTLAKELNEGLAANSSSTLTDEQLRKIAQIEKLAHSVKEKMADGTPQLSPAMQMPVPFPSH